MFQRDNGLHVFMVFGIMNDRMGVVCHGSKVKEGSTEAGSPNRECHMCQMTPHHCHATVQKQYRAMNLKCQNKNTLVKIENFQEEDT